MDISSKSSPRDAQETDQVVELHQLAARQQALSDDYYARRAIFPIRQDVEVIE